jgi:peptidoglycan/LPS O-acetylase OafA/YrhL
MQASQDRILNGNVESKPFRADIEGLRAVAVIGVVAFHFGVPYIPGGFVGVDIFFVISGYLITRLLIQELEHNGRIDLLRFYGRRARRLLPAVLLMTLVTLAAIPLILGPSDQLRYAASAAATSLYASNFLFLQQTVNYFNPTNASNPFLHTWSLGVEEQFYLVWPALLLLACRRRFRPLRLAVVLGSVTMLSFALCLWLTRLHQPWAFYASPSRAWEFGAGGLAALPWMTRWTQRFKAVALLGWVAAGGLILSFGLITEASDIPGFIVLLPVAATVCMLLSGAAQSEQGPARILRTAPFQWFGRRSYSLYLWHWPIIALAGALYPSLGVRSRLVCAAMTLICAAASYQWLEDPVRRNPWLGMRAIRSIALGAGLTVIGAAAAIGVVILARHFASSPGQRAIIRATRQMTVVGNHDCFVGFAESEPRTCVFGVLDSAFTMVLFGDSHAGQWSTPFASIADTEKWRMATYLKGGCSVADIPVYEPRLHRMSDECPAWRAKAIDAIVRLRPNIVVVSEFSGSYIDGPRASFHGHSVSMANWAAGMMRSLSKLRAAGSSIVLLRDTPVPQWDMRSCLENAEWRGAPRQTCDMPRSRAIDPALTAAERQLAAAIPGIRLVDLTKYFCSQTTCPAWRNGLVVYRDDSHVTNGFAVSLTEPVQCALVATLGR